MPAIPTEPQAFAEVVAQMLRQMEPEFAIDLNGPRELLVNGRRLDLENLYRMVQYDPSRGTEIVEHYLEQLFSTELIQLGTISFEAAASGIMPRIQPQSIFAHFSREHVAHVPFTHDTVIVFVLDLPHMTISLTTEQVVRWKVSLETLEEIALRNLDSYVPTLDVRFSRSSEGVQTAHISLDDGYDAARILLTDLHDRLRGELGEEILAAITARDSFMAFPPGPPESMQRLKERLIVEHAVQPYPITTELFRILPRDVGGTRKSWREAVVPFEEVSG